MIGQITTEVKSLNSDILVQYCGRFKKLKTIKILDLSGQKIKKIESNTFNGLKIW